MIIFQFLLKEANNAIFRERVVNRASSIVAGVRSFVINVQLKSSGGCLISTEHILLV